MGLLFAVALHNARMDQLASDIGSGALLRLYSGARPASVADAITGALLAELECGAPFADAAANGVLTANAIAMDPAAAASGTVTHFRLFKADGLTALIDGDVSSVAAGTGDLLMNTVDLVAAGPVIVSSFTLTTPDV